MADDRSEVVVMKISMGIEARPCLEMVIFTTASSSVMLYSASANETLTTEREREGKAYQHHIALKQYNTVTNQSVANKNGEFVHVFVYVYSLYPNSITGLQSSSTTVITAVLLTAITPGKSERISSRAKKVSFPSYESSSSNCTDTKPVVSRGPKLTA